MNPKSAFTAVNVLCCFLVIGLLLCLLIPALPRMRESARRQRCRDNLRTIGAATAQHLERHGHFPTGGWGAAWVGFPDYGFATNQPGGWIYNLLPYVDQGELRELGKGLPREQQRDISKDRLATPVGVFNCVTRRRSQAWAVIDGYAPHLRNPRETSTVQVVARSDYVINSGSGKQIVTEVGPNSFEEAVDYRWPSMNRYNGICHLRSQVRERHVPDGLSMTLLAGEKYLHTSKYYSGQDEGDNESMYSGFTADVNRYASEFALPLPDSVIAKRHGALRFGGPHSDVWMAVFCDGSVHDLSFEIDAPVFARLGCRNNDQSSD